MERTVSPGISYYQAEDMSRFRSMFERQCTPVHSFPKGSLLSRSGNREAPMYFVLSGIVKIYTLNRHGYKRILGYMRQNTLCALDRILEEEPAVVTVECVTDVKAVPVRMADIQAMSRENKDLMPVLLRHYGKILQLLCFDAGVQSISSVRTRVANFLYLYAGDNLDETGDEIRITQEELAGAVNASRVQVARITSGLQKEGILRQKRGRIIIHDREKLLAAAAGE